MLKASLANVVSRRSCFYCAKKVKLRYSSMLYFMFSEAVQTFFWRRGNTKLYVTAQPTVDPSQILPEFHLNLSRAFHRLTRFQTLSSSSASTGVDTCSFGEPSRLFPGPADGSVNENPSAVTKSFRTSRFLF